MNKMERKKFSSITTPVHRIAAIILLVTAIGVAYHRTLDNPFVWDDPFLITQNHFIHNNANLKEIFTRKYFTQTIEISYRPVNTLTFFADYAIWKNQPFGYHLVNLLIHLFNSILLFAIGARLLRRPWLGLGLALLFSVHPILTEALNGVTFREDPLCLLFMLLSFTLYLGEPGDERAGPFRTCLSILMLLAALFTKETAVVFPGIILASELFLREKPSPVKAFARTILYCVPAVFYLYIRFGPMRGAGEVAIHHGGGAGATLILMIQAWARYLTLSFWPARMCADQEFAVAPMWSDPATGAALFLLIAAVGCAIIISMRSKRAAFGAAWFVLMLLPVSNIIPIGVVMAERYLYIAMPGLLIFIGFVFKDMLLENNKYPSLSRVIVVALVCASIIAGISGTSKRNRVWDSEVQFWEAACDCAPSSARALVNLGTAYINNNRDDDAGAALVRAVRLAEEGRQIDLRYGSLFRAVDNLGIVFAKKGQMQKAIELFDISSRLNPNSPFSFFNLGVAYFKTGNTASAERAFLRGLEIDPRNEAARIYLITIYHLTGRLEAAIGECDRILALAPGDERYRKVKARLVRESENNK